MVMPPTLRWALGRLPMREEERARLEREAFEAGGFVNLERLHRRGREAQSRFAAHAWRAARRIARHAGHRPRLGMRGPNRTSPPSGPKGQRPAGLAGAFEASHQEALSWR